MVLSMRSAVYMLLHGSVQAALMLSGI